MKRRSPTLEGFKATFRLPSVVLAEIAWRWCFGLALVTLCAFSFREYMSTLPVTSAEIFLLQTRQPPLMLKAMAEILQGSLPRAANALIVLAVALTLGWIVLASLGRAATLNSLFAHFREHEAPRGLRLTSLFGLNFLRAAAFLGTGISLIGAVLLAGAASSKDDPSPGIALLIFWMIALFVGLAYSTLNWYLSLAAAFVVGERMTTFDALATAADLCRSRPGPVAAIATWFGAVHAIIFVAATSVVAFPLAFAEVLPAAIVLGGVILVTLAYFAVADFLYVGRLAAYVFLISVPETGQPAALPIPASDDDILSDIPGLVPPQTAAG